MALESRFLFRELTASRLVSWLSEVAEAGVRTPDRGRDASDEGKDLDECIVDTYGRPYPRPWTNVFEISKGVMTPKRSILKDQEGWISIKAVQYPGRLIRLPRMENGNKFLGACVKWLDVTRHAQAVARF